MKLFAYRLANGLFNLYATHRIMQGLIDQRLIATLSGFGLEKSNDFAIEHDRYALFSQPFAHGGSKFGLAHIFQANPQAGCFRGSGQGCRFHIALPFAWR